MVTGNRTFDLLEEDEALLSFIYARFYQRGESQAVSVIRASRLFQRESGRWRMDPHQQLESIVVTGSSGFIGTKLLERLAPNSRVIGFDYKNPLDPVSGVTYIPVDLTSDESVNEAFAQLKVGEAIAEEKTEASHAIDAVVHLAAYYDFSGESNPKYDEVTVKGTRRLMKALHSFDVGRFIFSSTMLVHAPSAPGQKMNEDWPIEPKWPYPESKTQTEDLILRERGRMPVAILRVAGVYDDICDSVPIANQIQRIYESQIISHLWPGDKSHGQAFIHLDDLIDAFVKIIERRKELPDDLVLLLGEEETPSYEDLQNEIGRLIHGEAWATEEIPKVVAKAGAWLQDAIPGEDPFIKPWMVDIADDHYELDISRAKELLDWEPKHSLMSTLPKMVEALKQDPRGWYAHHKLEGKPQG